MQPYADISYYKTVYVGTVIPDNELERALIKASRHIDTLTYNRIVAKGINELTLFQQDIIREVCCNMADFEYENSDVINSVLKSYGINGVNMSFGDSWNVYIQNGIAVNRDCYEDLCKTGLCNRSLGVM